MPKDKVIAYFSKYRIGQSAASSHLENGAIPLVSKNSDDRKVLVDAGNICVAPAKSRPKKRKTVKPLQLVANNKRGDGVSLQPTEGAGTPDLAEAVVWSEPGYTVRHLVKQFDGQFPVIVRVDEGHYREGVVDLARGLVLLVSDHGKQQRVLARNNSTEALLSLPVDYQMDILLSSSADYAEVVDFTSAVKNTELPFTATVCAVSSLSNTSHGNITGEKLTFLSVKDTVFLRANSISHGWVDQSEILVIPELVEVQFVVSEGLRGGTEQEWHDYQGMFARCVRHLSFSSVTGYQGILLEGPEGNELLLSSTSCLAESDPRTSAQSQAVQAAKERKKQRIAYENFRLSAMNHDREDSVNNPSAETTTNDYEVLLTGRGPFSETPGYDDVLPRSNLDRHTSDVRVVSCSSSTLDYRRPRDDRNPKQSVPTNGAAQGASSNDDPQRSCSVVSNANSETIDQIFDEIDDLNDLDQTLATADINGKAPGLRSIQPVKDNFRQEETTVTQESNRAENDKASGSFTENINGQVRAQCGDKLDTKSVDMDRYTQQEDLKQKDSTATEASGPINKLNVLQRVSKFQSLVQSPVDVAKPSVHPLQQLEGKSETKHADVRNTDVNPLGVERQRPVITEKPNPVPVNKIQPPLTPRSTVVINPPAKPIVADGMEENLSKKPNRWQQPQTRGNPPSASTQHQANNSPSKPLPPSSGHIPPPPLSRTTSASTPLPDSNPNRGSQLQGGRTNVLTRPNPPVVQPRQSLIHDVVIKSSADVPSELESLSVAGVSQCLELLHLDRHVTDFNRNDVDGRKLTDLTEKALEHQFQFTPLDASKLVRFVRGWRP